MTALLVLNPSKIELANVRIQICRHNDLHGKSGPDD